jgi:hypothetical protein
MMLIVCGKHGGNRGLLLLRGTIPDHIRRIREIP